MKHLLSFIFLLFLSSLFFTDISAQDRAREIFEEFEERRQSVTFETAIIEMSIIDRRGRSRNRVMHSWQFESGESSKSLLLFESPADVRGTGLLSITENGEERQWLYLPALGRVQAISGSNRSDRFVGSDFTFEDLGGQNPDHFELELLEENESYFKINASPLQESQYHQILFYIEPHTFNLLKAEYMNADGTIIKELTATDHTEINENLWRPGKMVMKDLKENRRTELRWKNREFPESLDESIFTERRLRRGL